MNVAGSLAAAVGLLLIGWLGATAGLHVLFGVVLPYAAVAVFLGGIAYRMLNWAKSPVPFRIPTTSGQQKSLPWIKHSKFDNPSDAVGVVGRMALEILFFRSLLKNTRSELRDGRLAYSTSLWLWAGALAFHWSLLIIVVRHLRFCTDPTPFFVTALEKADGFLQVGVPICFLTTIGLLAGVLYLLARRLAIPQLRYISLPADYFPLFLLLGIGITGFCLRHVFKTDLTGVKDLAVGLATFKPVVPATVGPLFYAHLFLVCSLLLYFPFSKLMHFGGVFLSPTRNLANNNRAVRHINPWDYPVKVHTYAEYEDEFRDKMLAAGLPVEKEQA